jgi:hypothetical protein
LLPSAKEFHLILRKDPRNDLPLGPGRGAEASLTLVCRAFTVTLENAGTHTVRVSGLKCFEPSITFEKKEPNSSTGWWPVSQPGEPSCETLDWGNTRLRPGEHTQYSTRLISPRRWIQSVGPGQFTLRAQWTLFGCAGASEGGDCLTPLQGAHQFGSSARVNAQEPITIYSNEVTVESPRLGDLGGLKFGFDVVLNAQPERDPTCTMQNTNVECTVFHFTIRNLDDRPVRNATFSCRDASIQPEYRLDGTEWKSVPQRFWVCTMNVLVETEILPGGTIEGTFSPHNLRPGYDASSLPTTGEYQFRFTFWPNACVARLTRASASRDRRSSQL